MVLEDPANNFDLPQTPSLSDGLSHVLLILTGKKGCTIFRRQASREHSVLISIKRPLQVSIKVPSTVKIVQCLASGLAISVSGMAFTQP